VQRRRNGREKERMEEGGEKDEEHGEKERIEVNVRTLYVTWHDAHVHAFHVHVRRRIHACVSCDLARRSRTRVPYRYGGTQGRGKVKLMCWIGIRRDVCKSRGMALL
jgi:hypothetical protein